METDATDEEDAETAGDPPEYLTLSPGTQSLVRMPSMRSPLWTLPPEAFENLLVVSATHPPSTVERLVVDRGGDPAKTGVVPVSGSPVSYDGPLWTSDVVSPANLSGIDDGVASALRYVKPGDGWIVVDNVNVLLMYASRTGVEGLVRSLLSQGRRRRARGVFSVVPEALSAATYRSFVDVFDSTVDRTDDGR